MQNRFKLVILSGVTFLLILIFSSLFYIIALPPPWPPGRTDQANANLRYSLTQEGLALLYSGKYQESITYFDKALTINPNDVKVLTSKGEALAGLGKYNESITYFDKALTINPNDVNTVTNKGEALGKLGKYKESITYFDKALTINPKFLVALNEKEFILGQQLRQQQNFSASLIGQNEVPPRNTIATGTFVLQVTADGRLSSYVLKLTNINNVTLVHIQQGEKGTNGPIVLTLFKTTNPSGQINGTLSSGKIFGRQFEGPLAGKYISDFIKLINEGKVYVNVDTKQNPQGEIRGQL